MLYSPVLVSGLPLGCSMVFIFICEVAGKQPCLVSLTHFSHCERGMGDLWTVIMGSSWNCFNLWITVWPSLRRVNITFQEPGQCYLCEKMDQMCSSVHDPSILFSDTGLTLVWVFLLSFLLSHFNQSKVILKPAWSRERSFRLCLRVL